MGILSPKKVVIDTDPGVGMETITQEPHGYHPIAKCSVCAQGCAVGREGFTGVVLHNVHVMKMLVSLCRRCDGYPDGIGI